MPITREFVYAEDRELGFTGLCPTWFDNADPTTGRGVAHDMLEHFRTQVGPVEGELSALGAFLAIRLEQGANLSDRKEFEILGGDIQSILADIIDDDLPVPTVKASRRLQEDYVWADDTLRQAVDHGIKLAIAEWGYQDVEASTYGHLITPAVRTTFVAWLRYGYRAALKRYAGVDLYTLGNTFFTKVTKTMDRLIQSDCMELGDRVRISLDPRSCQIGIRVNGECAYAFGYV